MSGARRLLICSAIGGALAVALGAFGAHALRGSLSPAALGLWQTGVDYLFWHLLAALFAARHAETGGGRGALLAAALWLAGAALFAGSLFALALGAPRGVGVVTPLGGLLLIAGWLALAFAFWRGARP